VTGNSDENEMTTFRLDPALLVPGMNVLAVEVHQSSATSSDVSFDFRLDGHVQPIPEPASIYSTVALMALLRRIVKSKRRACLRSENFTARLAAVLAKNIVERADDFQTICGIPLGVRQPSTHT
jgi:hypothetical protein